MRLQSCLALSAALAGGLALGACSPAEDDTKAGAPSQAANATSASTQPAVEPSTARATTSSERASATPTAKALSSQEDTTAVGPFSTDDVQAYPGQGTELIISDVRVGAHEGFDRVVFEFSGPGAPGYAAGYTPEPLQLASGYPIEVAGNAFLEVRIQGTPMGLTSPYSELIHTGPMAGKAAGNVLGITHGGVFEADTQYFIGLDSQRPYNLYVLDNPTRVVVDIQK